MSFANRSSRVWNLVIFLAPLIVLCVIAATTWQRYVGLSSQALQGNNWPIMAVAFSPDGKTLASVGGQLNGTGEVVLWDVEKRRVKQILRGHRRVISCADFSPNGKLLGTGSFDGEVRVWDLTTGATKFVLAPAENSLFSVGGKTFDFKTGQFIKTKPAKYTSSVTTMNGVSFFSLISAVAFSPDGKTLYSGNWDGVLAAWDVKQGQVIDAVQLAQGTTMKWMFSSRAEHVATNNAAFQTGWPLPLGSMTKGSIFHIKRTLKRGNKFDSLGKNELRPVNNLCAYAFSPNDKFLAVVTPDYDEKGNVRGTQLMLLNTKTHAVLWKVKGQGSQWELKNLAFSRDGMLIASQVQKGIRFWNATNGAQVGYLGDISGESDANYYTTGASYMNAIAFSPDGRIVVTADENSVLLWQYNKHPLRDTKS